MATGLRDLTFAPRIVVDRGDADLIVGAVPRMSVFACLLGVALLFACESDPPPHRNPSPREADRRGDLHLKAGRFDEAIADFDTFLAANPTAEPEHWRRGIAFYYAGRFRDGVRQFELHRTVNPDDVENAAWHFLCKARLDGIEAARRALLPVGPDARIPMRTVYEMFAGRASPADVAREARSAAGTAQSESALFYAHLYLGLYFKATGDSARARHHLKLSANTHTSPYYMGDIARMHAARFAK